MLRERLVRVDINPDVELFVAETIGDYSETLLVIHGGPDWDHTYLLDPLVRLRGEHRVVFVDLRGCGRSTRGLPSEAYTPAKAASDLAALIDVLGCEPVDVLGFSYGGLIAQRMAVTAPAKVRRLIVASSSVLPVPGDAFDGWTEREQRVASMRRLEDHTEWDAERTRLEAINSATLNIWNLDRLPEYLARLDRVRFSADWAAPCIAGTLPSPRLDQSIERLAALAKPLLLLQGRQDMTFPAGLVAPTLRLIPSARAAVLDDAGHMAHVDQPDAWLAAISSFLRPDSHSS